MHAIRSTFEARSTNGEVDDAFRVEDMIGESPTFRQILRQAQTVAPTAATVLVYGETGTGKEMVAKAIHHFSERRHGRLVKLNAAAIPAPLLESELFGHEKGAFTGAVSRRHGRFELAQNGTLFLDEIGELPLDLQPKLLRLLQEREYERLGGNQTITCNARLVVATNRDLLQMVRAGSFREDLFYRLNVFPIRVPALRERREDIPRLVSALVEKCSKKMGKLAAPVSQRSLERLSSHSWPGNVRELENVIERAVILAGGGELEVELPELLLSPSHARVPVATGSGGSMDEVQRAHILRVLDSTNWVISGPRGAAAQLGMKRSTLNFRIKKLGITRDQRRVRCLDGSG